MNRNYVFIFYIFSLVFAQAQNGSKVFNFMNTPISARQMALGGDAVSVHDSDISMVSNNPSLMNLDMDNRVYLGYSSYIGDSKIGGANYVRDLKRGHLFGVNARYMDFGNMIRTDENSFETGTFSAQDMALGVSYAYQIEEDWTLGGSINYVTSKIDTYSSNAILGDFGLTFHNDSRKEYASIVFRNMGRQIKSYNGVMERVPFRIDVGYTRVLPDYPLMFTVTANNLQEFNISQNVNNNFQEVGFIRKVADHFSFGVELFPQESFNIRLGYNAKRANELAVFEQRNFSGISAGFGLKISFFKLDFSHVRFHNASNINQLGITLDLVQLSGDYR